MLRLLALFSHKKEGKIDPVKQYFINQEIWVEQDEEQLKKIERGNLWKRRWLKKRLEKLEIIKGGD